MKTIKQVFWANRPVRWAMIAVAAAVLVAVPVIAQIQFSDVPDDNPHRIDINDVAEQRWFLGYRDGTYKPDQKITPAQMTRVLNRAFNEGITRAEFASFMIGGNEWKQRIKEIPGYGRIGMRARQTLYIVKKPDTIIREGIYYISPGRYRIERDLQGQDGWWDVPCRWMRLAYIPDGGQNFDTIAATDAALSGYIQLETTAEPHIIRIEPTDTAFMTDCL